MHYVHHEHADSSIKNCSQCGRQLHDSYPHELCPTCMEQNLFNEVKDFIRENEVQEQDVAEHFNIPLRKVRGWIREGRIQYKGDSINSISGIHCRYCGKPISFGVACPECHSLQNLQVVAIQKKKDEEADAAMRFLAK